jgi:hypothetical protein
MVKEIELYYTLNYLANDLLILNHLITVRARPQIEEKDPDDDGYPEALDCNYPEFNWWE